MNEKTSNAENGKIREALAVALARTGNVAEACREAGISRAMAYRRFRDILASATGRRGHPFAVSEADRARIRELALENPEWGCVRLGYYLELKGTKISSPTIQKILTKAGLGTKSLREGKRPG